MSRYKYQLAIVETSQLLFEGLFAAFHNADGECHITKVDLLDDFLKFVDEQNPFDLVVINPSLLPNRTKEIKKIRKNQPKLVIVGVATNLVENEIASLYDETFSLYDSIDHIVSKSLKLVKDNSSKKEMPEDESLSEREIEVLVLLIKGLSNKEIAENLNISIHTVITHRKNIAIKTGIRSQSGLTIYAISKKIVSLDDFE